MLNRFKACLAVVAVAAISLPALAVASPVPAALQETLVGKPTPDVQAASDTNYLAQAMRHALAVEPSGAGDDRPGWFSLPVGDKQVPAAIALRANSDLALWHLVATLHAQQKHKVFDLVDADAKLVWKLEQDHVSAVPLPGVLWLFVLGLLGLANTRVAGRSTESRDEGAHELGPVPTFA